MSRRSKAQELLDFEIAFYEKLLNAYPDFIDVLVPLGNSYTRRGLHEKGLEIDLRLTQLRSDDALTWYNLACSYALLNRVEEAYQSMQRAIEVGYIDLDYIRRDPDLLTLRQSPKFRSLIEAIVSKRSPQPTQEGRSAAS